MTTTPTSEPTSTTWLAVDEAAAFLAGHTSHATTTALRLAALRELLQLGAASVIVPAGVSR
jgi:hypothetical protein